MKYFIVAAMVILTTACGWQLRGVTELPASVKIMTLDSQANNRFTQRLKQQLAYNGVVFPSDASANVRLYVAPIKIDKLTLSVNALGQAAEYEISATLTARLIQLAEGSSQEWEVRGRRVFSNNIDSVIATQSEEKVQRQELENDLIRQLMNRLNKVTLQ